MTPPQPLPVFTSLWRRGARAWVRATWLLLRMLFGLLLGAGLPCHAQEAPGVRAEYFNYPSNTGTPTFPTSAATVDRIEDNINIFGITTSPAPGIGADYYLVRYTGNLLIPATGAYNFRLEGDDGIRLYVDCNGNGSFDAGETLINAWVDQSTTAYTAACTGNLVAGRKVRFMVEYYERAGTQSVRLSWTGPSPVGSTFVVIPKGDGVQGMYSGIADNVAPTLTSATLVCGSTTQITVVYSKPMQVARAQNTANYSLGSGFSVTGATASSDGLSVVLTISPALTADRTLTVNNQIDTSGNALPSGSTIVVPATSGKLSPGLLGAYYSQNGVQRAYFTGAVAYRTDSTVDFDWGTGLPGPGGIGADDFSVRWTGLIRVPTTGNYVFQTVSDDGVRLYLNGNLVVDNWTDHSVTNNTTSTIALTAGTLLPVRLEYYERGGFAVMKLQWQTPGSTGFVSIPASQLFTCSNTSVAGFVISSATAASTCAPQVVTVTAVDSGGATINAYQGQVNLSTSSGRGDWAAGTGPAPSGVLTVGASNSGLASYQFSAADAGVVRLQLSHSLAQSVTVRAVDPNVASSLSSSAAINFSNNAFVWAEDLNNRIAGTNVVVAGRPHDLQLSLIRRDPSTGSCGVATDFTGTRTLKLWRTDSGGAWAAPVASTGSTNVTVPASRPAANNLNLAFSAGIASLNLNTSDIGKYTLNVDDDSLTFASSTISGSLGDLTVRPYTLAISGIARGSTANPSGSAATDAVLARAGDAFSATVGAYLWSSASDTGNNGTPAAGFSLASITAGGLAPSFSSAVSLSPAAGSQTPVGGVLGSLVNGNVTGFAGGTVTVNNLQYSEVGSFVLNTSNLVTNFLGTAGLNLNAIAFAANGTQNARVGRFVPAGFGVSNASVSHRSGLSCSPASTFTYLDETFQLGFTISALNGAGSPTLNYTGSFAKLDLNTPGNFQLAGISGSTMFKPGGRIKPQASSGSWSNGQANVTLAAQVARAAAPDGPFDNAQFGIAPVDSDGVTVLSPNLDTDSPANGVDAALVGTIPLRHGRLRLQNAIGAGNRALLLPISAQHWNGTAFVTNPLDACTRITSAQLSLGNFRPSAVTVSMSPASVTVDPTKPTFLRLTQAGSSRLSVDVAVALSPTATDASCLKTVGNWTPSTTATSGANLPALQGAWCGSSASNDPSARATWGLYRGADGVVFQRENF